MLKPVKLQFLTELRKDDLLTISSSFPNLPIIGIARRPGVDTRRLEADYGRILDAYVCGIPRPEELIVSFPQVAAKYVCETGPLRTPGTRPLFQ